MKSKILLIFLIIFLLNSCKSWDILLNPDNYIQRDAPIEKEIIYDTVIVWINNDGINDPLPGMKPTKQIIFTNIGQTFTFKTGETIKIVSDGIDFSKATFDIETNLETNDIILKLVDKDFSKVYLTHKCQVVLRTGIDFVPKIELARGLEPEQIVITPVFDDKCNKIGFQIRYGSVERGCKKEAAEVIKRFNACVKNKLSKIKSENLDCGLRIKLGIPCK